MTWSNAALPESPSRVTARYAALLATGLLPITAMAVSIGVLLGRVIPLLVAAGLCGALIDHLGVRAAGAGLGFAALGLFIVGYLALILTASISDGRQLWLRWVRGQEFTVLYTRGWSFWRTVWAGIRGTNRLYQRRLGYRQLDL